MVEQGRNYSSDAIEIPVMSSSPDRTIPGSIPIPGLRTPSFCSKSNLSLNSTNSLDSLNISDSMTSLHSLSPSPGASLNRRWQRSQMTRLHNYQYSKPKMDTFDELQTVNRKLPKIGIGVIFKLWETHEEKNRVFQNFLFSHYSLFEGHVQRLKFAIERSFNPKKNFFDSVVEAIDRFKQDIICFYSAPRLLEPVWLHMMNIRDKQEEIAERFVSTLVKTMDVFEKKEESYFLSTMLTAVLTHHLAWVPTVMPSGSAPKRAYLDKNSSVAGDMLAKCHPYNPLWAQLSDLYGAVGYPPKVTKTIVVGKDPTLVRQLLYILSYFIRCSEIKEYSLKMLDEYDALSVPPNDHMSCCSNTPTNTQDVGIISNMDEEKVCCVDRDDRTVKEEIDSVSGNTNVEETDEKAFADHEEICQCMCSVLQSIDYIGSKGLSNIIKLKNAIKIDSNKQDKVKNLNGELKPNEQTSTDFKFEFLPDFKELEEYRRNYPTFLCYCCPEKHRYRGLIDSMEKVFPRQNSGESTVSMSSESKSCVCGEGETSEYESETRSNLCTLSRNSSCGSCLDYFKKFESRSEDSDYCSIVAEDHVNDDHVNDGNGIVLNLHEEVENSKSERTEVDELLSLNLTELQLPGSDIKDVPQRHFDHKVELPNFGRSLLGGYCDKFASDFALHGARTVDMHAIERELNLSLKHSVLDESVSNAAYIIADVDSRTCQLVTLSKDNDYFSQPSSNRVVKSDLFGSMIVSEMLESLKGLWHLNIPYQFCLMHLEDRLKDIYSKSKLLAEFVRSHHGSISRETIQQKMRFSESDLDLLIATGSTHCQFLEQSLQ